MTRPPLPVWLDLTDRGVVVAGGGPEAARAAASYARSGAAVLVVAANACEDLVELSTSGTVAWRPRDWRPTDLDGAWLIHAATGSPESDDALAAAAERARTWCVGPDRRATVERPRRRPDDAGPGWVALVGGGPGDPELLTLRGDTLLRQADVVVVDRLAPRAQLAGLDPDVEIIDVGKVPGNHPVPQEEINRILITHALAGRRVVRLKGGDPYVFGRGGEEALACREAGVRVLLVPGVTSALSVPAAAGIPVTHREVSRSLTVITGHEVGDPARVSALAALARDGGTLVVLMGVAGLGSLADALIGAGASADTPVALIEKGWTPQQRTTRTLLGTAGATAAGAGVRAPAVIVIGDVAALETHESAS